MKSTILIIVTVLLVIGTAVAVFFVIDASGLNEELTDLKKSLSDELASTKEDLEASQDEAETLTEDIDTLTAEKTSLTSEIETVTSEKEELSDTLDMLETDFDDLLEFNECTYEDYSELDISYGTNARISDILAEWVDDAWGGVTEAQWLVLWDDETDLALHTILFGDTSADYFLVFFDDSGAGTVNGVFYVWDQCWLDMPSFEE